MFCVEQWEEHIRRRANALTVGSWLLLRSSSFPQSLCSLQVPSAFCLRAMIWLRLLIFPLLYTRSHLVLHAHAGHLWTHPHTHEHTREIRTSRGTGSRSREMKVGAGSVTGWLSDRASGGAKAVKLSVSPHRSRRREPTLKRQDEEPGGVRSTRFGVLILRHRSYYFWWNLWDENERGQRSRPRTALSSMWLWLRIISFKGDRSGARNILALQMPSHSVCHY